MVNTRNETVLKSELITYLSRIGLDIHTTTKARGHNGFFKEGRIDISKNLDDCSAIKTILHEFAHYVNSLLDSKFKNSYVLFNTDIENLKEEIEIATKHVGDKDYKTVLQEKLQIHGDVKIEYEIIKETGPDHDKNFEAEVKCDGKILATGKGKSKKEAQMEAAKKALENLI